MISNCCICKALPVFLEKRMNPETIYVPNILDISWSEAKSKLKDAGLAIGDIAYRYSNPECDGKVLEQKPDAGTKVDRSSSIDLVVAKNIGLDSQARSVYFPSTKQANLVLAIKGDSKEQDWFYRRYATPIFCYLKKQNLPSNEAKDLTHEIILKLLENKFKKFNSQDPFRPYLMTTVFNAFRDLKKKQKREKNKHLRFLNDFLDDAETIEYPPNAEPEEIFDLAFAKQLLMEALRRLKERCESDRDCPSRWNIFYDFYFKKFTKKKIAQKYNISERVNELETALEWLVVELYKEYKKETPEITNKQIKTDIKELRKTLKKIDFKDLFEGFDNGRI